MPSQKPGASTQTAGEAINNTAQLASALSNAHKLLAKAWNSRGELKEAGSRELSSVAAGRGSCEANAPSLMP